MTPKRAPLLGTRDQPDTPLRALEDARFCRDDCVIPPPRPTHVACGMSRPTCGPIPVPETRSRWLSSVPRMGFFGTFVYADGAWIESAEAPSEGPSLRVDIHDSDIAQIDYRPARPLQGVSILDRRRGVSFAPAPTAPPAVDFTRSVRCRNSIQAGT